MKRTIASIVVLLPYRPRPRIAAQQTPEWEAV